MTKKDVELINKKNNLQIEDKWITVNGHHINIGISFEKKECLNISKKCNPNNYTNNCQRCITAYELIRRGYNVEAKNGNSSDADIAKIFDIKKYLDKELAINSLKNNIKTKNDLLKAINNKYEKQSRGFVFIDYGTNKHGFVFEKFKDGDIRLYETQSGYEIKTEEMYEYLKRAKLITTVRTDDKKIIASKELLDKFVIFK